jgi:hypothetical protein
MTDGYTYILKILKRELRVEDHLVARVSRVLTGYLGPMHQ